LAGGGFGASTLIHGIRHLTDSLVQVVVPGEAELNLKGGLTYTIFLEEQSVVNGKVYSTTESISGLGCRVSSIPGGNAVRLERPGANTTYTVGARSGHSVLEFSIREDGNYKFACDYGESSHGPEVVVAVGSGIGERISRLVAEFLGAWFGGLGLFLTILLVVVVKHHHERRRIRRLGQVPI
jgi:hypothetical protein